MSKVNESITAVPGRRSAPGGCRKGDEPLTAGDENWYYSGGPMHVLSIGRCAMIGTDMTILMGRYNGDHTDVALISDRRACPDAIGRAIGVEAKEFVYKTLRLGPQVIPGTHTIIPLVTSDQLMPE